VAVTNLAVTWAERRGFFFGWWVVGATAAIVFLTGGTFFYGFSALFNPIVAEFGWSRASVALAFSLRSEVGGIAAPIVGWTVDRVGSRRLMIVGIFFCSAGFALMSQMQSLPFFYFSVVVIAIGMSATAGPVGMVAIAHWFTKRRGRALSFMTAGAGTSGVMVLVLAAMVSEFGWRDALLILAVVQLAVCLPLAMSIRDKPEDVGLLPDGELADPNATVAAVSPSSEGLTLRQALKLRAFWQMAFAVMLVNVGMIAVIVHQIPYFTESLGVSDGMAAALVTVMTLTSLLGRFGMGQLADMIDKRRVLAISFATCALALVLFATLQEPWQIAYALPVFAIGWGGIIPVRPAFQAEYFGMRAFGAIQGIVFTVATLGGFLGPVFAGWMYDETESYRAAFLILSLGAMAAVPLVLTIKRPEWGASGELGVES
jgi:sugar phosphate permease